MSSYQPAVSREDCEKRLRKTFPREVFDPATANRLGASAVAAMIYVGAVVPDEGTTGEDATWCRPTSILWMSDDVLLVRDDPESRAAWLSAALRGKDAVQELLAEWGYDVQALVQGQYSRAASRRNVYRMARSWCYKMQARNASQFTCSNLGADRELCAAISSRAEWRFA